jgi:hypothetical protein
LWTESNFAATYLRTAGSFQAKLLSVPNFPHLIGNKPRIPSEILRLSSGQLSFIFVRSDMRRQRVMPAAARADILVKERTHEVVV